MMTPMDADQVVPEADAFEQDQALVEGAAALPRSIGDKPEADVIEQERSVVEERSVAEERSVRSPSERGEVPEADWFEQSIVEPLDDEVR
jgi:hypothetical protein